MSPRLACRAVLAMGILAAPAALAQTLPEPPPTRVEVVRDTLHGTVVEDPYRWLEDQASPETRAWIDAQNAYTQRVLAAAPPAEWLRARLQALVRIETRSVPFERAGRLFYTRRLPEQEQAVLCMRQGPQGPERVLVDPHPMSPDHDLSVGFSDVSDDGKLLAYSLRQGGEDEVSVAFLDLETGQPLADRLPKARYFGVHLTPDRRGLFYARHTPEGPRLHYHALGQDAARDTMLFGEALGPDKILSPSLSPGGRWLLITVSHGSAARKTELYLRDLASGGPIVPVVNDVEASFQGVFAGNRLYLKTDWQASNGRILAMELERPERSRWREVVPQGSSAIQSFSVAGGKLFVNTFDNAVSVVRVHDLAGRPEGTITFATLGDIGAVRGEWDGEEAYFSFTSFHVPTTIYRYDVARRQRMEWWRSPAPVESWRYEVKQVWYRSKDGTRIPMFLVHRKGLRRDGSHPVLLTGYGGFNLSQRPAFSSRAAVWIEQGGVFALPNLRGGGEFGENWHEAGMLARKQNVFDDFLAAAEWLIIKGYTRPERLAISGRSNGGLLVGAALTQRPDLFRAVVCGVPLLDMLRYHRFLVARYWVPEYGSAEVAEQFRVLRAYSPYHRVKAGERYPAVLFVTGDADTRVAPLHARKMTALLQASSASGRPVLLDYDVRFGHVGGGPASEQVEDLTKELRFLFWQLEVGQGASGGSLGGAAR